MILSTIFLLIEKKNVCAISIPSHPRNYTPLAENFLRGYCVMKKSTKKVVGNCEFKHILYR